MPVILIKIFKGIIIHLATKYAAELIVKHTIVALEKAAKSSSTIVDDDIVAVIKKEQDFIVAAINGPING